MALASSHCAAKFVSLKISGLSNSIVIVNFVTFILKNLLRRRARSLLTMCGVAVAVGTTIALLGVADDFTSAVLQTFKAENADIVVSPKGELMQVAADMPESHADAIRKVPGIVDVSKGLLEQVAMVVDDQQVGVLLQGWEHGSYSFSDLRIASGRMLVENETAAVMLGVQIAENLEAKVGDVIDIQDEDFKVVGVFEASQMKNGSIVMLLSELQELMVREESVTGFTARVGDDIKNDVDAVKRIAQAINDLTDDEGESLRLAASPTDEYIRNNFQLKLMRAMAWVTSLIAISVGTIGMLNTMIMSVMERVREISVLRAMGWRRSRIIAMIIGESVLLSLGGAILGAVFAIGGSGLMAKTPQVSGFLSGHVAPWVVLAGLIISVIVGLIGAAYPAWRAAKLLPSEGLRYE